MLEFLVSNWQILASALLVIISIIIALIRKKPLGDVYGELYSWCIVAVNIAEKSGYKGDLKLDFALGIVYRCLQDKYPSVKVSSYEVAIKAIIEKILTTPQKKGE